MSNDAALRQAIADALNQLEAEGDLVISTASPNGLISRLCDAVRAVVPSTDLTVDELIGLRRLAFEAIADESFFDWEMPTLTGYQAEAFREIAGKLPRG